MDPRDGVWRTQVLQRSGWQRRDIQRAVKEGSLLHVRRGWYGAPQADPRVLRAVKAGGALTCASALAHHGAWDVTGTLVHVRRDHNFTSPLSAGLKHCHSAGGTRGAPLRAVDDLATALRAAWGCLGPEELVQVCDSLLHRRMMTLDELAAILPRGRRTDLLLRHCDLAESGTETLVRLRLRRRGIQLRPQVWITPGDRVDLLVGERLVIEVDSRAHHTGIERFSADRERDLRLRSLGYTVVRLTYQQVVHGWPAVEQSLLAMVRRGDHRWRVRPERPA
ncbi:endonuclease domain-containing protein [Luteococcus sp.]|uniref:endonuclease domain-containing protein n=1 Tax=Luteococcus sp. TaxID=1969402 RepID=UPI003736ABEB